MSQLVNNVSPSMNVDYTTNQQPLAGSKRKATSVSDNSNSNVNIDLLNNQNSGFITANNINNSARQKISDGNNVVSSNNNSNWIQLSHDFNLQQAANESITILNNANHTIHSAAFISATNALSNGKKVNHQFTGWDKPALLSEIFKSICAHRILDGDGCAYIQFKDNQNFVTREPLHVHFKIDEGFLGKIKGKFPFGMDSFDGPLALINNTLLPYGNGIKTMPNSVVTSGKIKPISNGVSSYWNFVHADGSYQGKMPPDKVVLFDKKIENGNSIERAAYLPSGELVVDIKPFTQGVLIGKKENSPPDDGKVIGDKLQGNWVKFVRYDEYNYLAYDGHFENDRFEGTVYTPEGVTAKVEPPK